MYRQSLLKQLHDYVNLYSSVTTLTVVLFHLIFHFTFKMKSIISMIFCYILLHLTSSTIILGDGFDEELNPEVIKQFNNWPSTFSRNYDEYLQGELWRRYLELIKRQPQAKVNTLDYI